MIFFSWSKRINIGKWHYLLHTLIHCSFLGHYSVLSKAACLFYLTRCNHPRMWGQPTVIHHWYLIFPMPMIFGDLYQFESFGLQELTFVVSISIYRSLKFYWNIYKNYLCYIIPKEDQSFFLHYFLTNLVTYEPSKNVIIFCQNVKVWLFT